MADSFDLPGERSDDEDVLIGGMWDACFGEEVGDEVVEVTRGLRARSRG